MLAEKKGSSEIKSVLVTSKIESREGKGRGKKRKEEKEKWKRREREKGREEMMKGGKDREMSLKLYLLCRQMKTHQDLAHVVLNQVSSKIYAWTFKILTCDSSKFLDENSLKI